MAGQFGLRFRLLRKSHGSFTYRKSATWDRRLYFPSEGRHAVDFFARKIRRLRPGSKLRSWVPEASMLTQDHRYGHRVLLSYDGQPTTCYGCGDTGHLYPSCPKQENRTSDARTTTKHLCLVCST
jgi:hypothetical protein